MCEGDQACSHSTDSVAKYFLNGSKRNGEEPTRIYPIETERFVTVWANDYTLDQLDAGESVQGGIEWVTVFHLDYSNLSLDLCTYVVNFN